MSAARWPVSYLVSLTLVSRLELRKLRDYLSGSVLSIPRDVLHGLDLVVKENPSKQCVSLGRCFFPMNPPLRKKDLNHGIMAIGGFQQSLSLLLRDCPCAWTIRFCPFGRSCRCWIFCMSILGTLI